MPQSTQRLSRLLEATSSVNGRLDVDGILEGVARAARVVTGARYAMLAMFDEHGEALSLHASGVPDDDDNAPHWDATLRRFTASGGSGRHGTGPAVNSQTQPLGGAMAGERCSTAPDTPHTIVAPIATEGGSRGQLLAGDKLDPKGRLVEFDRMDRMMLQMLARIAVAAIESASQIRRTRQQSHLFDCLLAITQALVSTPDDPYAIVGLVTDSAAAASGAREAALLLAEDDEFVVVRATTGAVRLHEGQTIEREDVVDSPLHLWIEFEPSASPSAALLLRFGNAQARRDAMWLVPTLSVFASQAILAIQRAEAAADRVTIEILADHERIARDLHDVVVQRLFATGLGLQAVAKRIEDPALRARVTRSVDDLDRTIRDIRATILSLQTPGDSSDLRTELHDILRRSTPRLGLETTLQIEGPVESAITRGLRNDVLAVVQEGLSNAVRHAEAARVEVSVSVADSVVLVQIKDDGIGMLPETMRGHGGLHNMTGRATERGGSCTVTSGRAGGTVILWRVPTGEPQRGMGQRHSTAEAYH